MKKRSFPIAGVLAVAGWWAGCLSAEPAPPCLVGRTDVIGPSFWLMKYTRTGGAAVGACVHGGELVGLQKYQSRPYNDPTHRVAIKAASMTNPASVAAIGTFPMDRPVDNICAISTLDPAQLTVGTRSVSYVWSNVRFYVTANDPGTIMSANVQITEGACVATYDAIGVWPDAECTTDADCSPEADYTANPPRPLGSGINPDYATVCSDNVIVDGPPSSGGSFSTIKACVPAKPFPSLK